MDYFQGLVNDYLRARRSLFINTEFMISLDEGSKPKQGRHWYCDALAVDFKAKHLYLCEITYSATMQSLLTRLQAWRNHWGELTSSLFRDTGAPADWAVTPWVFLPKKYESDFRKKLALNHKTVESEVPMPEPRITHLEATLPWEYLLTWDRTEDHVAGAA